MGGSKGEAGILLSSLEIPEKKDFGGYYADSGYAFYCVGHGNNGP